MSFAHQMEIRSECLIVQTNPSVDQLINECLNVDACVEAESGAVVAYSGAFTGRTPKDKFVVQDATTQDEIWWANNGILFPADYERISDVIKSDLAGKPTYVIDCFAGADPSYRIAVRFVVERAYHALFVRQLLIRPTAEELIDFKPDWTVYDASRLHFEPAIGDGSRNAVIALNFGKQEVVISGTEYAGELKKSIFTVINYLLPKRGVLSMHCSANVGEDGVSALFFGLSGTGKTTLSADPERFLIGDDEHGWSDQGVFNIEGGCYAKCIGLKQEREPEIFAAIRRGAVLENVMLHDGKPDYDDASLTENTRAAYPIDFIPGALQPSVGGHPKNIFFLTCDALGVMPPISKLTPEQAMEHFLNGYTAKVAGTEAGILEPSIVFSACFGQPFLPLPPKVYAKLLGEKVKRYQATVWLINTGWTGGPVGVGERIKLAYTRAILHAAFSGTFDAVNFETEPVFGLAHPTSCPGVPTEILRPRDTWVDPEAYDAQAQKLRSLFVQNLAKFQ